MARRVAVMCVWALAVAASASAQSGSSGTSTGQSTTATQTSSSSEAETRPAPLTGAEAGPTVAALGGDSPPATADCAGTHTR